MRWSLVLVLVLACVSACTGSDTPTATDRDPVQTTRVFVERTLEGDCDAVKGLVVEPDLLDCAVVDDFADIFATIDLATADISVITEQSRIAQTSVSWPGQPEEFPVELFLQDTAAGWRVLLDSVV